MFILWLGVPLSELPYIQSVASMVSERCSLVVKAALRIGEDPGSNPGILSILPYWYNKLSPHGISACQINSLVSSVSRA